MEYYSIKMRSSSKGEHISGHERIVEKAQLQKVLNELFERGSRKDFDFLNIKVEKIEKPFVVLKRTLKVKTLEFENPHEANDFAINLLEKHTGIKKEILKEFISLIHEGANAGKNMRGAMIVDVNGTRLEKDREKGIRTTLVDYMDRKKVREKLIQNGFTDRTLDALALSSKNLYYPDIIAEYCISDESDYVVGYVATKNYYYRLNPLKEKGNKFGGRIYFVKKGTNIDKLYHYLQKVPVLIEDADI